MNIFCRVDDCRYIEHGLCQRGDISIGEDLECEDYESYLETEEWKKPFWKRMKDDDNNCICRVKYHGKPVDINGRIFFAENKSEYAHLTDEITGIHAGSKAFIKDNFDKLLEAASKIDTPLHELPIATYDEQKRVFNYEQEEGVQG